MSKQNCWESKKCGREPNGIKSGELGVCPASDAAASGHLNGLNQGVNGGRACWLVPGTLCKGERQGTVEQKASACLTCDFYLMILIEEGPDFRAMPAQSK